MTLSDPTDLPLRQTQIEQLAGRPALHLAELLGDGLGPRDQ
jgi:hypothetical protein